MSDHPIKIAQSLPPPCDLTDEDWERIRVEMREAREAMDRRTRGMEQLSDADRKIVIGGPRCACHRH